MKYKKMNKKGFALTITMIVAVFIAIAFLIFFAGGGVTTIFKMSQFISKVPTFIWVGIGVLILIRLVGGRK